MLIENMWPDLLKYPINPVAFKAKAKKFAKSLLSEKTKEFYQEADHSLYPH
jgi:uncharacterized protein YejL (UPF0352 family)